MISKQDLLQSKRSLVHHGVDREEHENEQLAISKELENDVADCTPLQSTKTTINLRQNSLPTSTTPA